MLHKHIRVKNPQSRSDDHHAGEMSPAIYVCDATEFSGFMSSKWIQHPGVSTDQEVLVW